MPTCAKLLTDDIMQQRKPIFKFLGFRLLLFKNDLRILWFSELVVLIA